MNLAKKSLFRKRFKIYDQNNVIGLLSLKILKGIALFYDGKELYKFHREKPLEGQFLISSENGGDNAIAHKTYGSGLEYTVTYSNSTYTLKPGRYYYENSYPHFEFSEEEVLLGTIARKQSIVPLKYYFEYKIFLPIEIQVFNFYLSMLLWYNDRLGITRWRYW